MKKILISFFLIFISLFAEAQINDVGCYPGNWWVNMKMNKIQIMLHAPKIGWVQSLPQFKYPSVKLLKINHVENPNYLFLDVEIEKNAKPGNIKFDIHLGDTYYVFNFELKPRRSGNGSSYAQGVTSKDLIYLIMPDRFSNGDTLNDRVA